MSDNRPSFDVRWREFARQVEEDGITSYCQQICNSKVCWRSRVCQFGIDEVTHMPADLELLSIEMKSHLDETL